MLRLRYTVDILRVIWIILLVHNEILVYWISSYQCQHYAFDKNQSFNNKNNVMLIADPQMTDNLSYNRPWIILQITKYISETYMKRNYKELKRRIQPAEIFIMGDLMDHGRDWNDEIYAQEAARFNRIFGNTNNLHYMAGNHDIGFGAQHDLHLLTRFQGYYGPTSYTAPAGNNYSFIILDTISLSSDDPVVRNDSLNLLDGILPDHSRILLTHVPLYRSPDNICGSYRQHIKPIKEGRGYQYQNMINKELSEYILSKVQPLAVFSGDDHDYCRVYHNSIPEITVPTFSMAQGLQYPGLVLLDLSEKSSLKSKLCLLPDQIQLLLIYGYMLVFSLFILTTVHILLFSGHKRAYYPVSLEESWNTPTRSGLFSFLCSIRDVAIVAIIVYISCNLLY